MVRICDSNDFHLKAAAQDAGVTEQVKFTCCAFCSIYNNVLVQQSLGIG